MVGTSVIDDQSDLLNVQTSGSNWGSNHDSSDAFSEVFDCEFSVYVVLAPMQDENFVLKFEEFFEEVVSFFLLVDENEDQAFWDPFTY